MSEEVMAEAWLLFKCSYKLLKNKVFYFLLLMSASARGERVAAECGADAFLVEPFELDDRYDLVEKVR